MRLQLTLDFSYQKRWMYKVDVKLRRMNRAPTTLPKLAIDLARFLAIAPPSWSPFWDFVHFASTRTKQTSPHRQQSGWFCPQVSANKEEWTTSSKLRRVFLDWKRIASCRIGSYKTFNNHFHVNIRNQVQWDCLSLYNRPFVFRFGMCCHPIVQKVSGQVIFSNPTCCWVSHKLESWGCRASQFDLNLCRSNRSVALTRHNNLNGYANALT